MEDIKEKELLEKCDILHKRHEVLKNEILERSILNEKAIMELNQIEQEYKNIVESLKEVIKY